MRHGLRGVAVEGKSDVEMLTAFLNAGEATGLWSNLVRTVTLRVRGKEQ